MSDMYGNPESAPDVPEEDVLDITVIGAGPAGLFTVFSAGIQEMKCRVIDSMPQVGGQLTALYPEKLIYDVPGFPKVVTKELVDQLEEQANQFHPQVHLNETVLSVRRLEHRMLEVRTSLGNLFYSRSVVIAAGIGAFSPRVPDEDLYERMGEDEGIFTCVRDKSKFADKDVVILGGGDSALDWILGLVDTARSVTLVHRRTNFRAMDHSVKKLEELSAEGRVKVYMPYSYESVETDSSGCISKLIAVEGKTGNKVELKCDRMLSLLGFKNDLGPIVEWNLRFEDSSIKVDSDMQTNIPGVFAVGDIAAYPQKIKLILTGFSDASIAVQNCVPYVRPGKKASHVFTSVRGIPDSK